MHKTKETLWKDYEEAKAKLEILEGSGYDKAYELYLNEVDRLRNELIKYDAIEFENETKNKQIESENKREKKRNTTNIITLLVTSGIGIWTVVKTFKFDEDSTITSTLGESSLNKVISKIFKV